MVINCKNQRLCDGSFAWCEKRLCPPLFSGSFVPSWQIAD
jgi:hypothetical protein